MRVLLPSLLVSNFAPICALICGCGVERDASPTVVGCDEVEYDGRSYSGFGCDGGDDFFRTTLTADGVEVTFVVECDGDCVGTAHTSGSSGGGDGDGDGGDGDGDGDGGGDGDVVAPGPGLGAACEVDGDCGRDFVCDAEEELELEIDGLPNGASEVAQSLFPGGSCTPLALGQYSENSCDPLMPVMAQGCGKEGVCVPQSLGGQTVVACRVACDPAKAGDCGRDFYRCDVTQRACVEGCQSDEECRVVLIDSDADGVADAIEYDEESGAECDQETFVCGLPFDGDGSTGDSCDRPDDCESNGVCFSDLDTFGGFRFPDGMCSKIGCDVDGRECQGDDAVCMPIRSWTSGIGLAQACLTECRVGNEAEEDRVGTAGHGDGCRPGYRCHYNGGAGARGGVCVGGSYNDISESNVGEPCEEPEECYSPYGVGRCLTLQVGDTVAPSGVCTLMDCAAPGMPDDLCGADGECIVLNGDVTFCVRTCEEASECPEGFACADDDGIVGTPQLCLPVCLEDDDCREGEETCVMAAGATGGTCQGA